MKYNLYYIEDDIKRIFKEGLDGETVRKFMSSLNEEQKKHIEVEIIREKENSPEQIMIRRNEEAWEK